MAEKKFIKIDTVTNEDANAMFNLICKDVIKKPVKEVRTALGLPTDQKVTTKDLISLIQEHNLECEVKVSYKEVEDDLPF